jgi:hypothetical protein
MRKAFYPLGVRKSNPTPRRLLASLQSCLWAVLALCLGTAWGSRTVDPLDLPKAERPILSDSAEDAGYYFNARWYSPERGSFTGRDPKLQFWTPYSYVGNTPLTLTDPSGMVSAGPMEYDRGSGGSIELGEIVQLGDIKLKRLGPDGYKEFQRIRAIANDDYLKYLLWPDAVGISVSGEFTPGGGAQFGMSAVWFPHDDENTGANLYFDVKPTLGWNFGFSAVATTADEGVLAGPVEMEYPGGYGWNAGLGLISFGQNFSSTYNSVAGGYGVGGAYKLGVSGYLGSTSVLLRSGRK